MKGKSQHDETTAALVFDASRVLFALFITSWLLETLKPGLMSSLLDLRWLVFVLVFVIILSIIIPDHELALTRCQRSYFRFFIVLDTMLLLRILSLQFSGILLVLVCSLTIILGFLLFFKIHD